MARKEGETSLAVFSRMQHALYGAVGHDDAWPETLRILAEAFDASFAMLVAAGQGQRDQSFYAAWNHPEEAARAYSDYWWQHDVWLQQGIAKGFFVQGNIMRGSDLVPLPAFRQSRFYREYLAPLSAEYLLVSAVSDGSVPGLAPPSHLSFFRRPDQPDFGAEDFALMQLIFPHVVRAFDLHWTTRRLQEQVSLLHRFLDALDFGVVLLDPAARVLYANHSVRAMSADPSWTRWLGSLPARVAMHEPLGQLVHACIRGQGGGMVLRGASPDLMALALPVEETSGPGAAHAQPGACMLLLAKHAQAPSSVSDFVMRLFGLSPAEARLLPLLLQGSAPAEMAEELGVKVSTVRSQLSSIFAKTGATRQQDLIRLLGCVPPIRLPLDEGVLTLNSPPALSLAAFDRVQHALYGAVGHDEAWPEVVRLIAEMFDASVACWCTTDGESAHEDSFYAAWNLPDELGRAYQDHWIQHNPWLHAGLAQGAFVQGCVLRGTDIVPAPALRQSRFYREYMALFPVEHMLTAVVSDGSVPGLAPPMILNLFRRPEQPDFDAGDVERLHLLFPHLLRAFDLHWSTRRLQEQVALLHRFLDTLDFGVAMLDPAARVLHANRSMRAMSADLQWSRWLGSLPVRVAMHEPLSQLVHACSRGQGGSMVLGGTASELMALALPIEARAEHAQPGASMLLLARHAQAPSAVSDFVARVFGLSPAEARLLPPLLRGSAPAEMAGELGVKISTVRSQLSAVFAKTGATRQQDLIRLLGSVPPVRMPKTTRMIPPIPG